MLMWIIIALFVVLQVAYAIGQGLGHYPAEPKRRGTRTSIGIGPFRFYGR